MKLREKVAEIVSAGDFIGDHHREVANSILAIPEIARALKACAFADAAVKATGAGVQEPDWNAAYTFPDKEG